MCFGKNLMALLRRRRSPEPTREFCYGKIHRCVVTEANLDYEGSITLDPALMRAAGIALYTKVEVVNVSRREAARIMTYAIAGEEGSGVVCLNGAAAHHFARGDIAIIMAYEQVPVRCLPTRTHTVVHTAGAAGPDAKPPNKMINVVVHDSGALFSALRGGRGP